MARILIIEDDFAIRQSVEYALRRAGYDVKTADTGAGAAGLIERYNPDLIVLDIMLPVMSGLEIAEALRQTDLETAIIMISALGEDSDKIAGLTIGADDYLAKPFSIDELLARVAANLRRVKLADPYSTDKAFEVGDLNIDPKSFQVTVAGSPIKLRAKEFALLYALARNEGQLSSRETLAHDVWGYEHLTSSRTIDVHIRRLRAIIEDKSAYRYIQTVHGMGYRFIPVRKESAE